MVHYTDAAGPLEIRVFQRHTDWTVETRLDLRTSWGSGLNTDIRNLPDLISALQRVERHARKAGLLTTTEAEAA